MAELADAGDLKSPGRDTVRVRLPLPAYKLQLRMKITMSNGLIRNEEWEMGSVTHSVRRYRPQPPLAGQRKSHGRAVTTNLRQYSSLSQLLTSTVWSLLVRTASPVDGIKEVSFLEG